MQGGHLCVELLCEPCQPGQRASWCLLTGRVSWLANIRTHFLLLLTFCLSLCPAVFTALGIGLFDCPTALPRSVCIGNPMAGLAR